MKFDMDQELLFCYTSIYFYFLAHSLNGDSVAKFLPQFYIKGRESRSIDYPAAFPVNGPLSYIKPPIFSQAVCVYGGRFKQTSGSVCNSKPCRRGHVHSLNHHA